MNSIYIVHQVVIDTANESATKTMVIGAYTSHENAIKQMKYILQKEYEEFIDNDDELEYSDAECKKLCRRYIKQLNKKNKCGSLFNQCIVYKIHECNGMDKIVGIQY